MNTPWLIWLSVGAEKEGPLQQKKRKPGSHRTCQSVNYWLTWGVLTRQQTEVFSNCGIGWHPVTCRPHPSTHNTTDQTKFHLCSWATRLNYQLFSTYTTLAFEWIHQKWQQNRAFADTGQKNSFITNTFLDGVMPADPFCISFDLLVTKQRKDVSLKQTQQFLVWGLNKHLHERVLK